MHSGVGNGVSPEGDNLEVIDFGERGKGADIEDGIQVTTVVEQDFERGSPRGGHGRRGRARGEAERRHELTEDAKSDSESTKELVPMSRSYL